MAHDWRKRIAVSVLALAAGTGLAAEAAAQTARQSGGRDAGGHRNYAGSEERCSIIDEADIHHGNTLPLADQPRRAEWIDNEVERCAEHQRNRLRRTDNTTRQLSRASGVGAFGALVSTATAQVAGTTNAWLGLGFTPWLVDDVQQRGRVAGVRWDYIGLLDELTCRATQMRQVRIELGMRENEGSLGRLRVAASTLRGQLATLQRRASQGSNPKSSAAQYNAIYAESVRLVGLAEQLYEMAADKLPDISSINERQVEVYNDLADEFHMIRSALIARPGLTFRSLLAAPLRASADLVGGNANAEPKLTLNIPSFDGEFNAALSMQVPIDAKAVREMDFVVHAPDWLEVDRGADRTNAQLMRERSLELARLGATARNQLLLLLNAGNGEHLDGCQSPSIANNGSGASQPGAAQPPAEDAPPAGPVTGAQETPTPSDPPARSEEAAEGADPS